MNLREVILQREAVDRGGKKGLLRQITLDFQPRCGAEEAL